MTTSLVNRLSRQYEGTGVCVSCLHCSREITIALDELMCDSIVGVLRHKASEEYGWHIKDDGDATVAICNACLNRSKMAVRIFSEGK